MSVCHPQLSSLTIDSHPRSRPPHPGPALRSASGCLGRARCDRPSFTWPSLSFSILRSNHRCWESIIFRDPFFDHLRAALRIALPEAPPSSSPCEIYLVTAYRTEQPSHSFPTCLPTCLPAHPSTDSSPVFLYFSLQVRLILGLKHATGSAAAACKKKTFHTATIPAISTQRCVSSDTIVYIAQGGEKPRRPLRTINPGASTFSYAS